MPKIIFITPNQDRIEVEAQPGQSAMQAGVSACIPGIDADCGGALSCATCHVRVTPEWMERVGPAGETERAMLEFDGNVTDASRLSCQIAVGAELDGVVLEVVGR
jgi:2Fe-2S ferredoxin